MNYLGVYCINSVCSDAQASKIQDFFYKNFNNANYKIQTENLFIAFDKPTEIKHHKDGWLLTLGNLYNDAGENATEHAISKESFDNLGRYCSEKLWGDYLLLGFDKRSKKLTCFRSPCCRSYFFYKQEQNFVYFASSIKLLKSMLSTKLEFNLSYQISYIMRHFIDSPQTAFKEIYELPFGCSAEFDNVHNLTCKNIWNPVAYCLQNISDEEFQYKYLQNMESIMSAYIRDTSKVVLDFSGGLDSTSLLHFIHKLRDTQQIVPINFYQQQVNASNELHQARKIIKSLELELKELELSDMLPFADINYGKQKIHPNWPTATMMYYKKMLYIRDRFLNSSSNDKIVYLSGHGGDNIFMCPPFFESLVDSYLDNGFKGLNNLFKQFFLLNRDPFFCTFSSFIANYCKYTCDQYKTSNLYSEPTEKIEWLTDHAYELDKQTKYHPLEYTQLGQIHPGKKQLLKSIISGISTIKCNLFNDHIKCRYPFFSENMIKLALTYPTYKSFSQGFDRYHVRKIVADYFNTQLVWRRDKGETTGILLKGFAAREKYLTELCMDGVCAQNGLVDKQALLKQLNDLSVGTNLNNWPIVSLITVELFNNIWI